MWVLSFDITEIRAEHQDTYVLELRTKYKSDFFKEKLRQMDIDNMTPAQRSKIQSKDNYRIDYTTRNVTRNFSKKFKFQTRNPFKVGQNTVANRNQYFMEITIENDSNNLFLQSVNFEIKNDDLEFKDINQVDEEGEIIGNIMKRSEK